MSKMIYNNSQNKYLKYLTALFKRNKFVLTLAVVIFFSFVFIGILIGYFSPALAGKLLTTFINALHKAIIERTTSSIFIHNFQSLLLSYVGGLTGIIPAISLLGNGFLYGAFLGYFMNGGVVGHYGISNPGDFIIYTLPHGIFEIPGFIIASAAGFRLTTLVAGLIKGKMDKTPASEHYWKLKDSLALFAIAVILIFIAAIIEANLSVPVGNYITGLNLP